MRWTQLKFKLSKYLAINFCYVFSILTLFMGLKSLVLINTKTFIWNPFLESLHQNSPSGETNKEEFKVKIQTH